LFQGVEVVKWLNSLGVIGILLKYRVPRREDDFPKYHHALLDAQRAMSLIRQNAEAWGVDPVNRRTPLRVRSAYTFTSLEAPYLIPFF